MRIFTGKSFILVLFALCWPVALYANEDEINLHCLKEAYPGIIDIIQGPDGIKYLLFNDGDKIVYEGRQTDNPLAVDVKESMKEIYPLEPVRPTFAYSPGRKRPYELFNKLYGSNPAAVQKKLQSRHLLGKNIKLNFQVADALAAVTSHLEDLARKDEKMRKLLKPEGGYYWRKIAGENVQSAHSWGIALDLGAASAPYWRWSRVMPHPQQQTYPSEIVKLLEAQGFIWGGKWREYDLMHFEYRPELLCKSRMIGKSAAD